MERVRALLADLRASLWLVPTLLVLGGVALAIGLVELDAVLDVDFVDRWPRLFGAGAEGARGMLATIAGSMITVAGVAFSVTIVALSLASSQYSPRVLRNFMGDRTNQVVLGVFVGVFAYCLVVLRTIRSPDEGDFVPSLAVLAGVLLAFLGVLVLIVFIHHIAQSIQASHIIANVATETTAIIDQLFCEPAGDDDEPPERPEEAALRGETSWRAVAARRSGYLQRIDMQRLVDLACKHDTVIRIEPPIGEFVVEDTPLMYVAARASLDEALDATLCDAVVINRTRTLDQDAGFGFRQLVDVALQALSPGTNDATTAISCIDYLSALYVRIGGRQFPSRCSYVERELRVVARVPTFAALLHKHVEELRLAAAKQPIVLDRLVGMLAVVGRSMRAPRRREAVLSAVRGVRETARAIVDPPQRERVLAEIEQLIGELERGSRAPPGSAAE